MVRVSFLQLALIVSCGISCVGTAVAAAEFDAKAFGLIPNNKDAAKMNQEAFQRAVQASGAVPGSRLIVSGPPAVYYIQGSILFISMSDMVLDFGGSTFIGTSIAPLFVFTACKRFTVASFAVGTVYGSNGLTYLEF
jgi:hypothetical protein